MGVIVDQCRTTIDAAKIEPASDTAELGERPRGDVELDADLTGHGQRAERVANVVDAAQRQVDRTERVAIVDHGEGVRPVFSTQIDRLIVRGR
jgi:hypothetical protein